MPHQNPLKNNSRLGDIFSCDLITLPIFTKKLVKFPGATTDVQSIANRKVNIYLLLVSECKSIFNLV